jgi:hypothetical protein
MHALASAILITWRRNGAYALRLIEGVRDPLAQPVAGVTMNHPAWILAHLNVYAPLAAAMATRGAFADPLEHRYGQKSTVVNDPSAYPAFATLAREYERSHAMAQEALERSDDRVFGEPNPLERWRTVHPTVGDMLVTLMVKHESGHLGQFSAWRRAMGMPSVPM